MNKFLLGMLTCAVTFSAFAWDVKNDPSRFDKNYQIKLSKLPLKGELTLDKTPWSSSFWPHVYGGIAFRWNNYYQTTPSFSRKHEREGELKKKIIELKKQLFVHGVSRSSEIRNVALEINKAKSDIIANNKRKAKEYQKYFFNVNRVTKASAKRMSRDELAALSAAEKYDLYKNDYKLKLTKKILKQTSPNSKYWEGICNGWSSASLEFHEPAPVTVTNKAGIRIPFGSSDLKALLSYYHAAITKDIVARRKVFKSHVGIRCGIEFPKEAWFIKNGKEYYKKVVYNKKNKKYKVAVYPLPPACVDTNPGAFHIIIANQLALKNQGFNAEVVRDYEIWNQPVYKYDSRIVKELKKRTSNRTAGTDRQVLVHTKMYYANDGGRIFWGAEDPEDEYYAWWNKTNGTRNYRSDHKDLKYVLDLNSRGNIIGGHWLSYDRPDFLWIKKTKGFIKAKGIVGYLNGLQNLVDLR